MVFKKKEVKIIALYLFLGCVWILFSDKLLESIFEKHKYIARIQTYKGWFYVLLTGVLFYIIIHKAMAELREKTNELEQHNEELNQVNEALVQSNQEIQILQQDIIESLVKLLEIHDQYTNGHSENVAFLSQKIAEEMALSEGDIQQVYWTGILHDIGKILIPSTILNKKGRLTDEEYELIKKHSFWGAQTLLQSKKLKGIAKCVLHHHERWDGRGYPDGLKGDEIPIISQIISLVDSWDAMTSNRPYREAMSEKDAIEEIKRNRGLQFAPRVVDVFLNYFELD